MAENKNIHPENEENNDKRDKKKDYLKSPEELAKEAEVTKEDLEALGPKDLSMDMGEDEELKHRSHKVDFDGKDLDIPGRNMDDDQEDIGSEDEENNLYSLGGDDND
jgi:hypothetical protein